LKKNSCCEQLYVPGKSPQMIDSLHPVISIRNHFQLSELPHNEEAFQILPGKEINIQAAAN